MEGCLNTIGIKLGLLLVTAVYAISAVGQHKSSSTQKSQAADLQKWTQQCNAGNPSLNNAQCSLWATRKEFTHKTSCPDHDASIACSSFQELVKADDLDMMRDLAQQDHVFACFRPEQDVFLEVYYSDPSGQGLQKHSPAGAEVRYFKNGIASDGMSFFNPGTWSGAVLKGDSISIQGSRLEASQTYRDAEQSGLQIHHTVILQLSTGRFTETYDVLPSGNIADTYSGRCLILPTAIP